MPGRNWLEALLLVLAVAFAGQAWASGSTQQTITATYPTWAQAIWYGGLTLGATLALAGLLRNNLNGWTVQAAALFFLGGIGASYGTAFAINAGRAEPGHAVFVVVFVAAFAAACLARAHQLRAGIKASRAAQLHVLNALAEPPAGGAP